MEYFSKYLNSVPTVYEETNYTIRYKTQKISTRVPYKTQNQGRYEILNKENKILRIIPHHLTVSRKQKDTTDNNY